jgi:tetratricopeptide (TPR) repeat protein
MGKFSAALNGYHSLMMARRPMRAATLVALFCAVSVDVFAQPASSAALRRQAFELAYNLDHDQAIALLRKAIQLAPDESANHRALASILWLNILFQRGAVTVDHYLGSFSRTQVELSKPPPELDAEFRKHVGEAVRLAEARAAAAPRDPQARYDLGAAIGLEASHIATVQGKMFAGFKAARRAYDEHERVIELDSSRKDAGLVVGTYRYIVSTLSLPLRMMAYVVGFGGGKEKGLQMLQETAAAGGESRTDAMFALVLMYNRERRYDDAMRILGELRKLYPRNRLVILEAGSTALRAGRAAEAESLLTEGLKMFAAEKRAHMPGEAALWHYKRGAARLALNQLEPARADLQRAIGPDAQPWVSGRAHNELARLATKTGDRTTARNHASTAQALCQRGNDPACLNEARRLARGLRGH